ncbi:MAG: Gfo/Idh/MocA family oxidoreductase [Lentisphaeria bacterium]|nr:Gfo/Idh/MocA family oxidoreductase [Lentisphaeria bacterium]NQZ69683.1 Gfo/Idh/MocA family oxidoreductase [Lentisphaeria bacterium]
MSKLRFGILGCGGMAGGHARFLSEREGVELVALSDVTEEILDGFIERNLEGKAAPEKYTDAAEMYANENLDAVVIVTPHTMHFDHGVQALDAGCHVFMEKPMVTSTEQAYKLKEKVDETGKVLVVGYNTPCKASFAYIREVIRNKTFGNLELVTGFLSQNWMKATAGSWRQKPELSGGGQAYDSGAHLMNSLVWSVEESPAEVFAFIDNHGTPVDINSVTNIRFANGVMASITVSGNCPGGGRFMAFIFDEGRIEVDGWGGDWIKVYGNDGEEIENPELVGEDQSPVDNFIDAINGVAEARTSPTNGIHQSELMDSIYKSAETGQVVKV